MTIYKFHELADAPLMVDAVYEGGNRGNTGDDPLCKLLPKTSNMGGFRITKRLDNPKLPAYITIYSTLEEVEWPDYLDLETGVFRYYGDNRHPGRDLHATPRKGNALLRDVFSWLNANNVNYKDIPPFLIFQKTGHGRDMRFLGLAAPGNPNIPPDRDLISFWRTMEGERFQNYEAYFTILDTKRDKIDKEWLRKLVEDHKNSFELAPKCWRKFVKFGRHGIKPLMAPKSTALRTKAEQLDLPHEDMQVLNLIKERYNDNPFGFEKCAINIVQMMDSNFYDFQLTRPWRDGGRDALAKYRIGTEGHSLNIDCAIEAKCYSTNVSVGVKEMSRLISRIRYRQFGILVTTSYVNGQAYKEIIEDGHPILILCAKDIVTILKKNGISILSIKAWLDTLALNN